MTDSKSAAARRRILKTLLAGGGVIAGAKALPEKWAKPVVESVVLPAHAQGSPVPLIFTTRPMPGPGPAKQPTAKPEQSTASALLDMIIPPAEAEVLELCGVPLFDLDFEVANPTGSGPVNICFSATIISEVPDFQTALASTNSANAITDFSYSGSGDTFCVGFWEFTNVAINGAGDTVSGDVLHRPPFSNATCSTSYSAPLVVGVMPCPARVPAGCGLE